MKATDLQINDWVCYDGDYNYDDPVQINGISIDDVSLDEEGFLGGIEDCIMPIPLTKEILELNDFHQAMFDNGNPTDEFVYNNKDYLFHIHFHENHKYWWMSTPDAYIHFHYVHELQHLLRICTLETLADNFKIK